MESASAAEAATRDGVRRLILFQIGSVEPKGLGALPKDARKELVMRAVDEAFGLDEPPRDRTAFHARVAAGRMQLPGVLEDLGRMAQDITVELTKAQQALRPLVGKPGPARAVVDDVQSQLSHLAPADWLRATSLSRMPHVLRYLRALQIRLQRQANDPQKDQGKAAQVAPLWQTFVARRADLRARGRTDEELEGFAWLVEELRVHVFAPELRTAVPVSPARVQELWTALSR
jgi:ATP-dependent helicase HrpA